MTDNDTIKQAVKAYLAEHRMKTVHLAQLAHRTHTCSYASVFHWLSGRTACSVTKAEALAGLLGLTIRAESD